MPYYFSDIDTLFYNFNIKFPFLLFFTFRSFYYIISLYSKLTKGDLL